MRLWFQLKFFFLFVPCESEEVIGESSVNHYVKFWLELSLGCWKASLLGWNLELLMMYSTSAAWEHARLRIYVQACMRILLTHEVQISLRTAVAAITGMQQQRSCCAMQSCSSVCILMEARSSVRHQAHLVRLIQFIFRVCMMWQMCR